MSSRANIYNWNRVLVYSALFMGSNLDWIDHYWVALEYMPCMNQFVSLPNS